YFAAVTQRVRRNGDLQLARSSTLSARRQRAAPSLSGAACSFRPLVPRWRGGLLFARHEPGFPLRCSTGYRAGSRGCVPLWVRPRCGGEERSVTVRNRERSHLGSRWDSDRLVRVPLATAAP